MNTEKNATLLELEQVANSVVCPATKETIIKYKHLIEGLITRGVLMEAMVKELGRFAQGHKTTKGINTVVFTDSKNLHKFQSTR